MFQKYLCLVAFFLVAGAGHAAVVREKIQKFENDSRDCKHNNSCSLKSGSLKVSELKISLTEFQGEDHFNTRAITAYETESVDTLTDYAVVQFLKGCRFQSRVVNGEVQKSLGWERITSFSQSIGFQFPDWVIDSVDIDPIYNSDYEKTPNERHYLYRWNNDQASNKWETEKFYGEQRPARPILYVKDMLSSAFQVSAGIFAGIAFNNSLQFRTCIFKTADLPKTTRADQIDLLGKPIKCFEWASSYIFDHREKKFKSPKKIDPFCKERN